MYIPYPVQLVLTKHQTARDTETEKSMVLDGTQKFLYTPLQHEEPAVTRSPLLCLLM